MSLGKHRPKQSARRSSYRMSGYDYSQPGAYFVSIATYKHECIFGNVIDGQMKQNLLGDIAQSEWFRTANLRSYIELFPDECIVMPNHVHGIIHIVESNSHDCRGAASLRPYQGNHDQINNVRPKSLSAIVRVYKSAVSNRINKIRKSRTPAVWQNNYYDHIIRDENEYRMIWDYIDQNPIIWIGEPIEPYPPFIHQANATQ